MRLGERVTCQEFIEFLTEYLDGELAAERREIFEAHLSICDPCVEYLRTYRDTVRMGQATADDEVPDEVPESLIAGILASRSDVESD